VARGAGAMVCALTRIPADAVPRFLLQTRYPGNGAQCKVRNFGVLPRMRQGGGHGMIRGHGELGRGEGGSGAPLYYCQAVRGFTITPPCSTGKKSAQQGGGGSIE
jgi:hypothetical protein